MPLFPNSTMRLSALPVVLTIIILIALALLIGKRLDLRFAGGAGAGPQFSAIFIELKDLRRKNSTFSDADIEAGLPPFPETLMRGATITTNAFTFVKYTLNDTCTIALAENSSLTLEDGRKAYNTFSFLTGRAVARGNCTLTTRETQINIEGTATIIHFSWLNKIVIKTLAGNVYITQSGIPTTLTPADAALELSTLPSSPTHKETELSLTQNELISSFYDWSLAP